MIEKRTIDISTGIIFRTILILLGIWFLYIIRDIVAILFVAVIITAAIDPIVNWMNGKKLPRSLAVSIIYVMLFMVIGGVFYFLIPPFVSQFQEFSQNFPTYVEKSTGFLRGLEKFGQSHNVSFTEQNFLQGISDNITQFSLNIFSTTIGVFSGFISILVVMSLTFYMSVKKDGMKSFVVAVTPDKYQDYAVSAAEKVKIKIGRWMQGQLFLMFLIFILDFATLYFLDVPYALVLAILGGALEIIPYLGPIISAVPAILLGFLVSPLTGILVAAAYIIIQQAESHIITPQIMKKVLGLNPIVVILALLIGAKIGGVLGAILSVPITTAMSVFVNDLVDKNANKNDFGIN
jgi:predicted PurR-regulated permease PerM